MGLEIVSALEALPVTLPNGTTTTFGATLTSAQRTALQNSWKIIAAAVVTHVSTNAVITSNHHTHGGVNTGGGTSAIGAGVEQIS